MWEQETPLCHGPEDSPKYCEPEAVMGWMLFVWLSLSLPAEPCPCLSLPREPVLWGLAHRESRREKVWDDVQQRFP